MLGDPDETDYDGDLTLTLNSLGSSSVDTQKALIISFCESVDVDDNTCNVPGLVDSDRSVEITGMCLSILFEH